MTLSGWATAIPHFIRDGRTTAHYPSRWKDLDFARPMLPCALFAWSGWREISVTLSVIGFLLVSVAGTAAAFEDGRKMLKQVPWSAPVEERRRIVPP